MTRTKLMLVFTHSFTTQNPSNRNPSLRRPYHDNHRAFFGRLNARESRRPKVRRSEDANADANVECHRPRTAATAQTTERTSRRPAPLLACVDASTAGGGARGGRRSSRGAGVRRCPRIARVATPRIIPLSSRALSVAIETQAWASGLDSEATHRVRAATRDGPRGR